MGSVARLLQVAFLSTASALTPVPASSRRRAPIPPSPSPIPARRRALAPPPAPSGPRELRPPCTSSSLPRRRFLRAAAPRLLRVPVSPVPASSGLLWYGRSSSTSMNTPPPPCSISDAAARPPATPSSLARPPGTASALSLLGPSPPSSPSDEPIISSHLTSLPRCKPWMAVPRCKRDATILVQRCNNRLAVMLQSQTMMVPMFSDVAIVAHSFCCDVFDESLRRCPVSIYKIKTLLDQQEELYERQSHLKALLEISTTSRDTSNSAPSVALEDWSGRFSWDSQADDIRFNVFGISSYRSNQREIINSIMSGKDVLVIMAAGGGKSLCYQLPAVLRDGITLVVSPLLSLIQDQVMGLAALGIPAHMLTSTTNKEIEKFIYKALEKGEGELKILYVTPEKISKSKRFMSKLEKCHHAGRLSLVAIDEAHCCSQWGHDFRPDYKNLGILKIQFPSVPMIALTATATSKVQMDLIEMLHIPRCVKFVSSVNRPNLFYRVYEKSSVGKVVIDEIANFISESYPNNESGIVYCFSRKECEQVAKELRGRGISADYYHADMDAVAREKIHTRWSKSKSQVIVGTVAFGMGINKPDVRFVVHHSLSKSMETYYQESGRAGRDGLPSECVLYYRPGDVPRQSSMVFYENCGLENLYSIARYCQSKKNCRRGDFFQHFGEAAQECNGMCDNCASSIELKDIDATYHTKIIVSLLQELQQNDQRATLLQLLDKYKTKWKHLGCSNEAVDLKKEELEQLIIQLILDRVLKEEFSHTAYTTNAYVALGPLWKQALQGNRLVKLTTAIRSQDSDGGVKSTKRNQMSSLESKLDDLRRTLSSAHGGIFPHAVLTTQQISLLNIHKPTTIPELEKLIGKLKTNKYGNDIIEVMRSEAEGGKDSGGNGAKRQRKDKDVVSIESSEEEA